MKSKKAKYLISDAIDLVLLGAYASWYFLSLKFARDNAKEN